MARERPSAGTTGANAATGDRRCVDHPVPSLGERLAVVSNPFRGRASADGKAREHLGADLMYRRRDTRDLSLSSRRERRRNAAVLHARRHPGARRVGRRCHVREYDARRQHRHHPSPQRMGDLLHASRHACGSARRSVIAGQPIGTIGASPEDAAHLRHLHLELWKNGTRSGAVDPAPYLAAWPRVVNASWTASAPIALAPRNAGLSYRPVGDTGEAYPDWLRRVRGSSGVYVIRERGGSSSTWANRRRASCTRRSRDISKAGVATKASGVVSTRKDTTPASPTIARASRSRSESRRQAMRSTKKPA